MAESPIRLPSAANHGNARGQGRDIATADNRSAPVPLGQNDGEHGAVIVHTLPRPLQSAPLIGWAQRVGTVKLAWLLLVVVLPTIGSAIYYFSIAANQYVSEFLCVVQPVDDQSDSSDGNGFRSSGSASRTALESNVVVQYIRSAEIVNLLEQQIGLRALYSAGSADIFSRLSPHASNEELLAYWDSKVESFYDMTTGTVSVKVKAFTAQDAQMIASQVIHLSENLVNAMSARARRDAVKTDEQEVNKAADQLHQISEQILAFRNRQQMIDPKKEAESSLSLLSKLREQLALSRADLATYGTATEAPGARVVQNRIVALQQQIAAASAPMTSAVDSPNEKALSTSVGGFEDLDTKRVVAEKYYDSALATLEKARYDADRQMTYLAVFVEPNLPESSLYPHRTMSVVLTLLAGFGIWIFGIVIVHSIREHI